jgi:hypothetical protein
LLSSSSSSSTSSASSSSSSSPAHNPLALMSNISPVVSNLLSHGKCWWTSSYIRPIWKSKAIIEEQSGKTCWITTWCRIMCTPQPLVLPREGGNVSVVIFNPYVMLNVICGLTEMLKPLHDIWLLRECTINTTEDRCMSGDKLLMDRSNMGMVKSTYKYISTHILFILVMYVVSHITDDVCVNFQFYFIVMSTRMYSLGHTAWN